MQSEVTFVTSERILRALLINIDAMRRTAGSVHLQMLTKAITA
jgi:hypothetical protein